MTLHVFSDWKESTIDIGVRHDIFKLLVVTDAESESQKSVVDIKSVFLSDCTPSGKCDVQR